MLSWWRQRRVRNKLIILTIGIILIAWMAACERKLSPEDSCNFVQNSDLQRVSWAKQTPVKMYVDSSVPTTYYPAIQAALDSWNNTRGHQLLQIEGWGITGHPTPERDGYSIIYWETTWDPTVPNEQARTTIYWSGTQIYEADMRINAYNFTFWSSSDTTNIQGVDLQSLVLHEFGHVLGLVHVTTIGSVMVPTLAPATPRRTPGPSDIQSLSCEY
jgi:hypothetical protein